MKSAYVVVYVTAPKGPKAKKLATTIVKNRWAACVNIIPAIQSIYHWKGKVEKGGEALLIIKTRQSKLNILMKGVKKHHPYDVPEIIALPIRKGHKPYLDWIHAETK